MGDFAYMVFIVVVLTLGQAVLWAWVGLRAGQVLPWWPIKVLPSEQPKQPEATKPTSSEA